MAARSLLIRNAIVTQLLNIGVTPSTGWESGAGAPQVLAGGPPTKAVPANIERQIFVQHSGTDMQLDVLGAGGPLYRYEFFLWLLCPSPTGGEDMLSKLERDVRRAVQLGQGTLEGATLANAGIREGTFEVRPELQDAGVFVGFVRIYGDVITAKGAM